MQRVHSAGLSCENTYTAKEPGVCFLVGRLAGKIARAARIDREEEEIQGWNAWFQVKKSVSHPCQSRCRCVLPQLAK